VISGSGHRSVNSENATLQVYDLLSQKPLRVFSSPQKLEWHEQKILLNNQWVHCRMTWSEIISGEFWSDPFERRYGFGFLESGEKLWIFKEGEHLYLQGMFV
jgi:hypothetical protein